MKILEIPRTVIDTKYEASDGTVFDYEDHCLRHEDRLLFEGFKLDESKTSGPLTEDNWQHYMFKFLNTFVLFPQVHGEKLSEREYHEKTWVKDKHVDKGFKISLVKDFFIRAFKQIPGYEKEYERQRSSNSYGRGRGDTQRFYKEDITLLELYKFMLESGLLCREDVFDAKEQDIRYIRREEEPDEKEIIKANIHWFNKQVFFGCFNEDSIEALEIALKFLKIDLYDAVTFQDISSTGGGTKNLRADFITRLATLSFADYFSKKNIDDFKRVKWLKYLLEKDLPIKLFKVHASNHCSKSFEEFANSKENLIYIKIEDLISEVKKLKNDSSIFIFKKNHAQIVELLENKCGPNFKAVNENNELPKYFKLAQDSCNITKEIFAKYPDIKIKDDSHNLFELRRIVSESSSDRSDSYRSAEEIHVEFYIDTFNREYEKQKNVCVVELYSKTAYSGSGNSKIKKIIHLKDFVGKPDLLALEMVYYLNAELPLGPTAHEKVKEIDFKLFEIQKQKELLAKEEENLQALKKETSVKRKK